MEAWQKHKIQESTRFKNQISVELLLKFVLYLQAEDQKSDAGTGSLDKKRKLAWDFILSIFLLHSEGPFHVPPVFGP